MNFYKHYIGDFQRDTGHLSLTERGAYRALLDHHYATEKPLPKDATALCRLVGAVSKEERAAVSRVLSEFWEESSDGWINQRAQREMGKASHQREVNRVIATAREAKRNASRITNDLSTNRSTNDQPNQTPDTRHQTKNLPTPASVAISAKPPNLAAEISRALREKNVMSQPMDPRLIALAEAGVTPQQAEAAAEAARDAKGPNARIAPAYVFAILERWIAEPQTVPNAARNPTDTAAEALRLLEERDHAQG